MAPGHPNSFRMPTTFFFAASSSPQMSISGLPPANFGSTICVFGTVLKHFTTLASGTRRWTRSPRESFGPMKRPRFDPWESSKAFVVSMINLPAMFGGPASRRTSSTALPRDARTRISPCFAVSSNVPVEAFPFVCFCHITKASLFGFREAIFTS